MLSEKNIIEAWCFYYPERREDFVFKRLACIGLPFRGEYHLYSPAGKKISIVNEKVFNGIKNSGRFIVEPPLEWCKEDENDFRGERYGIPVK